MAEVQVVLDNDRGNPHVDGTLSLARAALSTATGAAFFICIGQQPRFRALGAADRGSRSRTAQIQGTR
jgi:hypothetical protein